MIEKPSKSKTNKFRFLQDFVAGVEENPEGFRISDLAKKHGITTNPNNRDFYRYFVNKSGLVAKTGPATKPVWKIISPFQVNYKLVDQLDEAAKRMAEEHRVKKLQETLTKNNTTVKIGDLLEAEAKERRVILKEVEVEKEVIKKEPTVKTTSQVTKQVVVNRTTYYLLVWFAIVVATAVVFFTGYIVGRA